MSRPAGPTPSPPRPGRRAALRALAAAAVPPVAARLGLRAHGVSRGAPSRIAGAALPDAAGTGPPPLPPARWVPDTGDGWYRNPVLFADYSDPDAVRVGDDFFLVSSSFQCTPGLPILHSTDLVNWTIVGHGVERLPSPRYDVTQPGGGVWAPSLRRRDDEFRIYFGDPDLGIFLATATDARGPWSPLALVQEARGWIDPCPLWDDDGRAYLVHAWAKSRAGFNGILTVRPLSPDGRRVTGAGVTVFDGGAAHPTIEGPKFYKRNGYYYIFAPAGGVSGGWQTVLRSRHVFGPYEARIALAQGATAVNGPHQGAWVETASGQSWFLHFQDRGAYGRVVHLQPMAWKDDWPVIGTDADGDGTGEPVERHAKPRVATPAAIAVPQTSDDFAGPALGLQWQWNANSRRDWWSLTAAPGALRLFAMAAPSPGTRVSSLPTLLTQKFPAPAFSVTATVDGSNLRDGQQAGLAIVGLDCAWIGVVGETGRLRTARATHLAADSDGAAQVVFGPGLEGRRAWLRVRVDETSRCEFSTSLDGTRFTVVGEPFQATAGKWVGARVGLFATAPAGRSGAGSIDVLEVRVE